MGGGTAKLLEKIGAGGVCLDDGALEKVGANGLFSCSGALEKTATGGLLSSNGTLEKLRAGAVLLAFACCAGGGVLDAELPPRKFSLADESEASFRARFRQL